MCADLLLVWSIFGGPVPQLSQLPTAMCLSVTESVGAAQSYRRQAIAKLEERACMHVHRPPTFRPLYAESRAPKDHARRQVAVFIGADVRTKSAVDQTSGIGADSAPQAPVRGRGRGSGATSGHQGDQGHSRQRPRPQGVMGFQADQFLGNQFESGQEAAPKSWLIPRAVFRGGVKTRQRYGPMRQANLHLRSNGLCQGKATR